MKYPKSLTEKIIKCAEYNMSQSEIADLLQVSCATIHRIKNQIGLELTRKVRTYEQKNTIHREAGESERDNVERSITEPQPYAKITGAERAAREAKIRYSKSPEGRLKEKLKGVNDLYVRSEIKLGHRMLEFEKSQRTLPSSETRPCTMHKGAAEIAKRRKENAAEQGKRLLLMLTDDQAVTAAEAAVMLDDSAPRTSNYLIKLFETGQLCRARDYVVIKGYKKRQWRWVFGKQPITPKYNFENKK